MFSKHKKNILHTEKEKAYYLKSSLKKISSLVISSHIPHIL